MSFALGDFRFVSSGEPLLEDDTYVLKTDDSITIQACIYGNYFIPNIWIEEERAMKHLAKCNTLNQAIRILNKEVKA